MNSIKMTVNSFDVKEALDSKSVGLIAVITLNTDDYIGVIGNYDRVDVNSVAMYRMSGKDINECAPAMGRAFWANKEHCWMSEFRPNRNYATMSGVTMEEYKIMGGGAYYETINTGRPFVKGTHTQTNAYYEGSNSVLLATDVGLATLAQLTKPQLTVGDDTVWVKSTSVLGMYVASTLLTKQCMECEPKTPENTNSVVYTTEFDKLRENEDGEFVYLEDETACSSSTSFLLTSKINRTAIKHSHLEHIFGEYSWRKLLQAISEME